MQVEQALKKLSSKPAQPVAPVSLTEPEAGIEPQFAKFTDSDQGLIDALVEEDLALALDDTLPGLIRCIDCGEFFRAGDTPCACSLKV